MKPLKPPNSSMDEMLLVSILLRNRKHHRFSNPIEVSLTLLNGKAISGFNDKDGNVGQHAPVFSTCW